MEAVRIALAVALGLLFATTGGGKLAGSASSLATRDSLHLSARRWRAIGVMEIVGVVGLLVGIWVPAAGIAAAVGAAALMVGAIATRIAAGERASAGVIADAVVLVLAVMLGVLSAFSW